MSEDVVDRCPKCQIELAERQVSPFCPGCGTSLPDPVVSRLHAKPIPHSRLQQPENRSAQEALPDAMISTHVMSREMATVVSIIGILLLILGAFRWNSIESQLMRGFGRSDGLAVLLLLAGTAGLVVGSWALLSRGSMDSSAASGVSAGHGISAEERLRQLRDLRAQDLITDDEYRQRKENIVSTL